MMRAQHLPLLACLPVLAGLAACAGAAPDTEFLPSKKTALELRAAQTRLVAADADTVMRGTIATLQDLGYRITRVEPGAGDVSATRQTALRMAVIVQPRSPTESVVRANATIVELRREAQVDSPVFYQQDFFDPLGATLGRSLAEVPPDIGAPDPIRPAAELNTIKQRESSGAHQAAAPNPQTTNPQTGTQTQ